MVVKEIYVRFVTSLLSNGTASRNGFRFKPLSGIVVFDSIPDSGVPKVYVSEESLGMLEYDYDLGKGLCTSSEVVSLDAYKAYMCMTTDELLQYLDDKQHPLGMLLSKLFTGY